MNSSPRSNQLQSLVISIHEHLIKKNVFDAHYLIDSLVPLGRAITKDDEVPPSFWRRCNDIVVSLFQDTCSPESGYAFLRGLSLARVLDRSQDTLKGGFDALGAHYLEVDLSAGQASDFIKMVNTFLRDDAKVLARPRIVHLLAMAKHLETISDDYQIDRDVLEERLKANNRFAEDIGFIINPLLSQLTEYQADSRTQKAVLKLAEPLYELTLSMSNNIGVLKVDSFLANLHWLCITRQEVGEFKSDSPISFCNPHALGRLASRLLSGQFNALVKSINSPIADLGVTYGHAEQIVTFIRSVEDPLSESRKGAFTQLFCALLACHYFYVDPHYRRLNERVVAVLNDLYPEVDLSIAERIMKRKHANKLSLYIKSQHEGDLGKLSSQSRDRLFIHDLGL